MLLFVPQTGPTFTLHHLQIMAEQVPDTGLQTIIDLFIRNRIPPSWVDHSYVFGLNYINHQHVLPQFTLYYDEVDYERLERLGAYSVPPSLSQNGMDGDTPLPKM